MQTEKESDGLQEHIQYLKKKKKELGKLKSLSNVADQADKIVKAMDSFTPSNSDKVVGMMAKKVIQHGAKRAFGIK